MLKYIEYDAMAVASVEKYIRQYRTYFEELYSDTGIFGEKQIVERYIQESYDRREEIFSRIEERLSPDIVHGHTLENTLFLSWRSKTLFIAWEDE
jgi:hypothetical protein